ncbi:MAG: VWA domain-containing protein, partial [Bacteroidota bacterium]
MKEHLKRWRLILGSQSESSEEAQVELDALSMGMDEALEALYDSDREGGLGSSSPNINRWLGDIRKYFPSTVVEVIQKDALERLDLAELLREPELVEFLEPNVDLVATILSLNKILPSKTKATARLIVQKLVKKVEQQLKAQLQISISGAINRAVKNRHPKLNEINWHKTILKNIKHYQADLKTIIPEQLVGYGKQKAKLKHIILLVDQSGSMASSVVYTGIIGSILASIRSIKTHLVVFDTQVVDLTQKLEDPVELLFATQLGGGTDIGLALQYAESLITHPQDTILFLISDLYEGGRPNKM